IDLDAASIDLDADALDLDADAIDLDDLDARTAEREPPTPADHPEADGVAEITLDEIDPSHGGSTPGEPER
ncbi:MAG: hypothetical protein R3F65_32855, partial [bacterium]